MKHAAGTLVFFCFLAPWTSLKAQTFDPTLYVGDWSGQWHNITFGSVGPVTLTISIDEGLQTFTANLDFGGFVFGASDPPPEVFNGTYTGTGIVLNFNSATGGMGTMTIDASGNVTFDQPNVPAPNVDSVTSVGTFTNKTAQITATINLAGGLTAFTEITLRKQVLPIAGPMNLVATSNGNVTLDWTDASDNEKSFEIERQLNTGGKGTDAFNKIGEVGANTTTFADMTTTPGTTYDYRVRAVNTDTTSTYSNTATATTSVPNQAPVAVDDSGSGNEDVSLVFDVLQNDNDPDGDPLALSIVSQPGNGAAFVTDRGTPADLTDDAVIYTPDLNYNGPDSFVYQISDGNGGTDQATVSVTVIPVNDPPDIFTLATPADGAPVTIGGASGDDPISDTTPFTVTWNAATDPESDPVTYRWELSKTADFTAKTSFTAPIFTQDTGSATTFETTMGAIASVLSSNGVGLFETASWFHRAVASDNLLSTPSEPFSIQLTLGAFIQPNQAPVATDDDVTTDEDVAIDINVLSNDNDPDSDPLTISIASSASNGQADVNTHGTADPSDDTITYTPGTDYNGPDSFNYDITDGRGGSDQAIVSITVTPVNDPPGAFSLLQPVDGANITVGGGVGEDPVSPDTPFLVTWEPASDPDSETLTYTWELSTTSDFSAPLFSQDVGTATQFQTTVGVLAALLTANGISLEGSATLFHRTLASDTNLTTASAVFSATMTRGTVTASESDDVLPETFALGQNYPNPFRPITTIDFSIPRSTRVDISIFDLQGRIIHRVVSGVLSAGVHQVRFDAGALPSGVYLYRMQAGDFRSVKQLIVLR